MDISMFHRNLPEGTSIHFDISLQIAAYQSIPCPTTILHGTMATLDVYESLNVKEGQIASSEIWVENYQKDHLASVNVIQVGWNVSHFILIDAKLWYILTYQLLDDSKVFLFFADSTFLLWRQQNTFPYRMDGTIITILFLNSKKLSFGH